MSADPLAFVRMAEERRWLLVELYGLDDPSDPQPEKDGKRPKGHAWQTKGKPASVGRVTTWRERKSNVGLLPDPSGLVVLDVEPAGLATWPRGRCPASALRIGTPSGGFHLYLELDAVERVLGKLSGKLVAPGAELISFGGQVVVPPSVARSQKAPGGPRVGAYTVEVLGEPLADGSQLHELLSLFVEPARAKARAKARPAGQFAPSDTTTRRGRKVLDAELRTIATAPAGERHSTFIARAPRVYAYVAGGEIAEDEAEACLRAAYTTALPDELDKLERDLCDARRYGFEKPCYPARRRNGRASDSEDERASSQRFPEASGESPTPPASEIETGPSEGSAKRNGSAPRPPTLEDARTRESARLMRTDIGNGERLALRHAGDLLYCEKRGGWHWWDGRRWAPDETRRVESMAKAVARAILREADTFEKDDERAAHAKHAAASEREARVRAALWMARSEGAFRTRNDELDADPWLLNVENGTLDLRTGTLRPHRREDKLTKLAPVVFDPSAKCVAWEAFLSTATCDDAGRLDFLQRWSGYMLTGDTSEDVVLLLDGPGGGGKSTLLETLKAALGDYAQTIPWEALLETDHGGSARPEVARLVGARLVVACEVERGRMVNAGLLKALSGGDTISARGLYRDPIEFRPVGKLLLAANDLPHFPQDDSALWRRIRRVRFPRSVEEPDTGLRARLREPDALAAVLAWALRGLAAWRIERLAMPPSIERDTEELRERPSVLAGARELVARFVAERCERHGTAWTSNRDLFAAFDPENLGETSPAIFGKALNAIGFPASSGGAAGKERGRAGLRLKNEGGA